MPLTLSLPPALRNTAFVKAVYGFVNRVTALPGFTRMPVIAVTATILLVVVGGFGTFALPLVTRLCFWSLLMGWSVVKWQLWFALTVRRAADWARAVLLGAVLLNLSLPFEIVFTLRLLGIPVATRGLLFVWADALAISLVVLGLLYLIRRWYRRSMIMPAASIHVIVPGGVLAKAGIASPAILHALRAEDHYCRLFLADGRTTLVHHRFGDALAELAGFDGQQVHRGAWAANAAVVAAEREGRAWRLVLADGTRFAVSPRFVPGLRALGWLNRAGAHRSMPGAAGGEQ